MGTRGCLLAAALMTGCSEEDGEVCLTIAVPGIELRIATAADCRLVKVVVREGGTVVTDGWTNVAAAPPNECVFHGAYERVGTFAVEVTAAGYRPVTIDGIVVTKSSGCHVVTEKRIAVESATTTIALLEAPSNDAQPLPPPPAASTSG